MNFNSVGRDVSRQNRLKRPELWGYFCQQMQKIDPTNADEYLLAQYRIEGKTNVNDGVKPLHIHFYRGDYTLHCRPEYSFSVKMSSNRTIRTESINDENILGYYLPDGSTCIMQTGNEYYDIMPLWNWDFIPGTTSPDKDDVPTINGFKMKGVSCFAGGVSDSQYGVSAYSYFDEWEGVNTGAKKSWFFFDDEVVCLGSDIHSDYPFHTTIDQSWGGHISVSLKSDETILDFDSDVDIEMTDSLAWAINNGVGYLFPEKELVSLECKRKDGNWNTINKGYVADAPESGSVFKVSLPHIDNNKYNYVVIPNAFPERMNSYMSNSDVKILANSDTMQVVYHSGLDIYGCVFYYPSKFLDEELTLTVDNPCALMVKQHNDEKMQIYMADLTQSQPIIELGIETKFFKDKLSFDFTTLDYENAGITLRKDVNQPQGLVPGDVNGDCKVDATDIADIVNYLTGKPTSMRKFNEQVADVNGDGTVNAADIVKIVNTVMGN